MYRVNMLKLNKKALKQINQQIDWNSVIRACKSGPNQYWKALRPHSQCKVPYSSKQTAAAGAATWSESKQFAHSISNADINPFPAHVRRNGGAERQNQKAWNNRKRCSDVPAKTAIFGWWKVTAVDTAQCSSCEYAEISGKWRESVRRHGPSLVQWQHPNPGAPIPGNRELQETRRLQVKTPCCCQMKKSVWDETLAKKCFVK